MVAVGPPEIFTQVLAKSSSRAKQLSGWCSCRKMWVKITGDKPRAGPGGVCRIVKIFSDACLNFRFGFMRHNFESIVDKGGGKDRPSARAFGEVPRADRTTETIPGPRSYELRPRGLYCGSEDLEPLVS
jgi:hypothetical protein